MKPLFFLWLVFSAWSALGQQAIPPSAVRADSTLQTKIQQADSLQNKFRTTTDSLQNSTQKLLHPIDSATQRLTSLKDSLAALNLSTTALEQKIDSLAQAKTQKLTELQTNIRSLQQKTVGKLDALQLPPEVQQTLGIDQLTKNVSLPEALQLPGWETSNPFADTGGINLPTSGAIPGVPEIGGTGEVTQTINQYTGDLQQLSQGNPDQLIENRATQLADVKELNAGQQQLSEMQNKMKMDSAAIKDMVMEQIQQPALDHFAGKEHLLTQAMDKMSKLKRKYTDVPSLKDLPKRVPNAMKGKPLIERLLPGISFQFQNTTNVMLDVNPYLLYKVSGKIEAGIGWNHRLEFDRGVRNTEKRIYGPRAHFGFLWKKGFSVQIYPEYMNTLPARNLAAPPESKQREWVFSLPVGVKKTFRITRWLYGHSTILYNIVDPRDKSPFTEPLMMRFGFEFPMRKRIKPVPNP